MRCLALTLSLLVLSSPSWARPPQPSPEPCHAALESACVVLSFEGPVTDRPTGERLLILGRSLARDSQEMIFIEGPGIGPVGRGKVPTLAQQRAEKVALILESTGISRDRMSMRRAPYWRVVSP